MCSRQFGGQFGWFGIASQQVGGHQPVALPGTAAVSTLKVRCLSQLLWLAHIGRLYLVHSNPSRGWSFHFQCLLLAGIIIFSLITVSMSQIVLQLLLDVQDAVGQLVQLFDYHWLGENSGLRVVDQYSVTLTILWLPETCGS